MKIASVMFALLPAVAWAGSFDGTWVTNGESIKVSGNPDTYLVANGTFSCDACGTGLKLKADGKDHKVKGHPYYDTASATVLDDQRVQTTTHAGTKLWGERTHTVSADGKTMTEEFVSYEGPNPVKGKASYTRVAPAPAGAHALSGSWQLKASGSTFPSEYLTVTFTETPGGLKMNSPLGQSYDAKFDGKEYPIVGDTGKTKVSLKRIDDRTIQETDTRGGKVTDIVTYKVTPDGKIMRGVDDDKVHNNKMTYTAEKKSP